MRLVITCARPGLIRGGVRHPKSAEHLLRDFSPDQLREMLSEPELALTLGRPLTFADVAAIEAGTFGATDAAPNDQGTGADAGEGKPAVRPMWPNLLEGTGADAGEGKPASAKVSRPRKGRA